MKSKQKISNNDFGSIIFFIFFLLVYIILRELFHIDLTQWRNDSIKGMGIIINKFHLKAIFIPTIILIILSIREIKNIKLHKWTGYRLKDKIMTISLLIITISLIVLSAI